jgi:hypothetical protein
VGRFVEVLSSQSLKFITYSLNFSIQKFFAISKAKEGALNISNIYIAKTKIKIKNIFFINKK